MADTLRDLVIRLGFDVNTTALPQIDAQMGKVTQKATMMDKALGSAFGRFAGPAALAGGAFKGISMVTSALVDAGDASVEFGKQMASVQTLLPGQDGRVKELGDGITDLAKKYGRSTADIASGTYEVISAFGDTKDTLKSVEVTLQGAIAGNTDLANAQQLVNATTQAYGDTSLKTQRHVMDMAAQMQNLGLGKIPEFATRMGMVTGSAKMMNVSMEELFGVVGRAAGVTGTTAESITQLHATLTALMNPTADMKKAFKTIFPTEGVKNIEELIGKKGLVNTLTLLADKTDHSAAALKKMFGPSEAVGFISQMTTTLKNETIAYTEANRTAYDVVATGARSAAGGLNKTGTELAKLDEQFTAASKKMGARLAPAQLAWAELKVTAIGALDAITERIEKESGPVQDGDSTILRMQKQTKIGRSAFFEGLGAAAAMKASSLSGDEKGAAAIRDAWSRRRDELLDQGDPQRRAMKELQRQSVLDETATRQSKEGAKAYVTGNTFTFTLPAGADAKQYGDAVEDAITATSKQLAWNVQLAASGDSP